MALTKVQESHEEIGTSIREAVGKAMKKFESVNGGTKPSKLII